MPIEPSTKTAGAVVTGIVGVVAAVALVTTGGTSTKLTRAPLTPLVSAPIIVQANRDVSSKTGLQLLTDATVDPAMSVSSGSGSVRLPGRFSGVVSTAVRVTKGQVLTLSAMARSETAVSGELSMYAAEMNTAGQWAPYNGHYFMETSLSFQGTGKAGEWQEIASSFTAEHDGNIGIFVQRYEPQFDGSGTMWIDDFAVFDGVGVQRIDPGPRTGFDGSLVKVSETGEFSVRNVAGVFVPTFLDCLALNGGSRNDTSRAVVMGSFGCNTWAYPGPQSLGSVDDMKRVDRTACMQVAQYLGQGDFSHQWAHLEATINAINASTNGSTVVCYWWDNEVADSLANYRAMVTSIRRADGGRRPIVMLQSHTYSRAFTAADGTPLYDVMGSYYVGAQQSINRSVWFAKPTTMCEMNSVRGEYRKRMQACLDGGGTMSSLFADGTAAAGDFGNDHNPPPVETWPNWPDFVNVHNELVALTMAATTTTVAPTAPPATAVPATTVPVTVPVTIPVTTIPVPATTIPATTTRQPSTTTVVYYPVRCVATGTTLVCRS